MSDESITRIQITIKQGTKDPRTLAAAHYWSRDSLTGEPLSNAKQASLLLVALDNAAASVEKNIRLWGAEGLLMEVESRDVSSS